MFFVPSKETHEMVVETLLPYYQSVFKKNVDKLLPLSIYGTEEETLKKYSVHDLIRIIKVAKERGIDIVYDYNKPKDDKICKVFEEYSIEELKKLYKSYTLFCVTEYMKYCKRYKSDHIDELYTSDDKYKTSFWRRFFNSTIVDTIDMNLSMEKYKDESEKRSMQYKQIALKTFNDVLFWCDGGIEQLKEDYEKNKDFKDPQEKYDELHSTDNEDIKHNRATKLEMYKFIWNSLRFASLDDLVKLNKLAEKSFITRDPGRPAKNIPVYVFDRFGMMAKRYNNRQECMETEGLGKQYMQQLLNGDKKRNKCTYIEMTDEKYKEYVDNFNNIEI